MKEKLILFAAKILWWVITVFSYEGRTEIVKHILNEHMPNHHVHSNPKRKAA